MREHPTPYTQHPTNVYAVVLVGGKGKRLKPLSTASRPKAFLSITKDRKTMFRRTLDRIRGLVPDENIVVVANRAHARLVKKDFPGIKRQNLILEPVSRNTAPAITLAAPMLEKRDPAAVMAVLPTDQYITEEKKFLEPLRQGIDFIRVKPDSVVIMGVKPRFPSTHFGYIKVEMRNAECESITKVRKFVEKPDRKTAERYLRSGCYLWNMGAFLFKASFLLKLVKEYAPAIDRIIGRHGDAGNAYRKMPNISIDYAVIEKTRNVYCAKAEYEWHDLGGFESLIKILTREGREFKLKGGKVVKIK